MSQRFVDAAFGNISASDQVLLCIEQHDSQNFLSEELHVGAGSINGFLVIEHIRTSMLTLGDRAHGERSHHRLGPTWWEELTQLLERSAEKRFKRAEVADQGSCD